MLMHFFSTPTNILIKLAHSPGFLSTLYFIVQLHLIRPTLVSGPLHLPAAPKQTLIWTLQVTSKDSPGCNNIFTFILRFSEQEEKERIILLCFGEIIANILAC